MENLHLFIDNSNLYIEGQRVAREKYHYDDELVIRLRISYLNLVEKIRKGRDLKETVLVGSKPPQSDGLWKYLETHNIKSVIFERSFYTGKEKAVDAELTNAIRDTLEDVKTPATIAIVAGDKDYLPTLQRVIKKGWKLEIYFWDLASGELRRLPIGNTGVSFISLSDMFNDITFKAKSRE